MQPNEWDQTYTEQNAKAEQIGAGIAVGCVGFPLALLIFFVFLIAVFGQ
jgi:hypothetical protein